MPKYLVSFTVPVNADTPAKAAAKVREYFRLDRTLKVTIADGDKINDDFWAEDETVTFVEPPFTEED